MNLEKHWGLAVSKTLAPRQVDFAGQTEARRSARAVSRPVVVSPVVAQPRCSVRKPPQNAFLKPWSKRRRPEPKWWADKGFEALSDGLSACDCKKGVTNANGETFDIATGCYRCAGTVAYGITSSTGCYVSDSVSKFDAI